VAKLTKNEIFGFLFQMFFFEYNHSKTVSGVFHDLKNVKIAEFFLKIGQLLQILATFYEFKSRFEKSW
jgi:sugar phosphate permease